MRAGRGPDSRTPSSSPRGSSLSALGDGIMFVHDLCSRLPHCVQLTTDADEPACLRRTTGG